jgi:hypothetical protein
MTPYPEPDLVITVSPSQRWTTDVPAESLMRELSRTVDTVRNTDAVTDDDVAAILRRLADRYAPTPVFSGVTLDSAGLSHGVRP